MGWYSDSRRKSAWQFSGYSASARRASRAGANEYLNKKSNWSNVTNPDGSITSVRNRRRSRRTRDVEPAREKTQYGIGMGLKYGPDFADSSVSESHKDVEETIDVINPYGDEEALKYKKP